MGDTERRYIRHGSGKTGRWEIAVKFKTFNVRSVVQEVIGSIFKVVFVQEKGVLQLLKVEMITEPMGFL